MCFSVFSSTVVQVSAVGPADKLFSVKSGTVKDGKVTVPTVLDKYEGSKQTYSLTVSTIGNGACDIRN